MFKKLLASIGFGSATVDLVLDQKYVVMGKPTTGKIQLRGGKVEQEIEGLSVDFCIWYFHNSNGMNDSIISNRDDIISTVEVVKEPFVLKPDEYKELPFYFVCPTNLPVSFQEQFTTSYYFRTNLEIHFGADSEDRDYVDVYPPPGAQRNFFEAFEILEFKVYSELYTGLSLGGKQVIRLKPTTWLYGKFDMIAFEYYPHDTKDGIYGFFEIDRSNYGMASFMMDVRQKVGSFHFTNEDLATVEDATECIKRFILDQAKELV
jgi:sporulation-control protein